MGFFLLVQGVGMGGGTESTAVSGPYCVCESEVFVPGAEASQGDCC